MLRRNSTNSISALPGERGTAQFECSSDDSPAQFECSDDSRGRTSVFDGSPVSKLLWRPDAAGGDAACSDATDGDAAYGDATAADGDEDDATCQSSQSKSTDRILLRAVHA